MSSIIGEEITLCVSAMASTSTQQSSSSFPLRDYDVFLSFRGEDTRKNFTDHLFAALVRHGFYTFRDNQLKRGELIGSQLLKTIEESRVSIIIFSRNYADSRWCLDELVKILECKRAFKQIVVPVFYDVDPSDVRAQRGGFAEAFERHEERYKGSRMEAKIETWRAALTEAANLSGWDLQNVADGHESTFIETIVEDISAKLNLQYLDVTNYPVGIDCRVQRVKMLLSLGMDEVRMVGIWGIGGIGKTTIAKAIYNLILHKFEGSSFIASVREISKQPNGLVQLQEQLLSNILVKEYRNIRNVDQGIELIKQRLWCRSVLVVLDDVDNCDQLNALAIRRDWFRSRSRIIVITRDESLLKWLEVDEVYEPEFLTKRESLELFSWHAFRKDHPIQDYVELSGNVVDYAGGLPLVLKVLGSFLFDKTMLEWKGALEKLKVIPHGDIQEKLRISFDSLNDKEKEIFLDIACFFVGMDQDYTIKILEGCGLFPEIGIGVLTRRCLVRINGLKQLTIHDMLRDMGREIVREEDLKEPGKRSRLWFEEDVLDVLTNHLGTEAVEGLALNLPMSNDVRVNAQAFAKMNRLRLLKLNYVHLSGNYEHLSKRLRWLCWSGFPLKSIPSNLFMEKVVVVDMPYSKLKQVWKGRKILNKLKFLNLSHSYHLTETPDFSGCTSLEMLWLHDCTSLVEVHKSIEYLNKLVLLELKNCKNLRKLPIGIWKLTSLENLSLSNCSKLEKLPGPKGSSSKSLFSLFSSWVSPVKNPDPISRSLASTDRGLVSVRKLDLKNCNLSYVPDELGSLISLEHLNLVGNNFCTLPASICHLSRLGELWLSQCKRLQSLPRLPVNLKAIVARDCTSLERISIGSDFQKSPFLTFAGCHKLADNNCASNSRSPLQNQELSADGEFSIIFPGSEVPNYFNYQSMGPFLYFVVPLLPNRKIRGWTLCLVIIGCIDEMVSDTEYVFGFRLFYEVDNKTKGVKKLYELSFHDNPLYLQDHTWFHCASQYNHELQMEAGDIVQYSAFFRYFNSQFQVKKCGVSLIYEDNEKDFPSYDEAVADTKIMEIDKDTGSDDPTPQSAPSTLKQGRPSYAEKGKAIAVESDQKSPTHARKHTKGIVIEEPIITDVQEAPTNFGMLEVEPAGFKDDNNDGVYRRREIEYRREIEPFLQFLEELRKL